MRRILHAATLVLATLVLAACTAAPTAGAAVQAPPTAGPPPTAPVPAQAPPPAIAGTPDLDRRCRVDSDCVVKDVGSCCGYRPACVNTDARPDPEAVQAACARGGIAGVCGFREIQACACVQETCTPAASTAGVLR